jgi:hypothetical protein
VQACEAGLISGAADAGTKAQVAAQNCGTPVACRGKRFCFIGVALKIRAKSLKLHRRDDGEQKAKAENIGAGHFHPSGWPACRP